MKTIIFSVFDMDIFSQLCSLLTAIFLPILIEQKQHMDLKLSCKSDDTRWSLHVYGKLQICDDGLNWIYIWLFWYLCWPEMKNQNWVILTLLISIEIYMIHFHCFPLRYFVYCCHMHYMILISLSPAKIFVCVLADTLFSAEASEGGQDRNVGVVVQRTSCAGLDSSKAHMGSFIYCMT